MHRQHRADLEDLERGVWTKHVVYDEHAVAVRNADTDGLARTRREQLRPRERTRAQLAQVEVAVRQLQELRAELVLVALLVLLDQSVVVERPQKAVHGRLRKPEPLRELTHAEASGVAREGAQNPGGTIVRLDHEIAVVEQRSTL